MSGPSALTVVCAGLLVVAGCASEQPKNIDMSGPAPPSAPEAGPQPEAVPVKAAEIMRALAGRSFRYSRGATGGTITFAADGTFTYEENGKGKGSGLWQASEGQLCQAFNPTSFLPKGSRSECRPFRRTGAGYGAGAMRYDPI